MDFTHMEKALRSLNKALNPLPQTDLERDGVIQRFEYSFELLWKHAKRVLAQNGIESHSPRSVIRDMAQQSWIDDADAWMSFLDARNLTTHTYNEEIAEKVFLAAQKFLKKAKAVLIKLKDVSRS